MNHLDYNFDRFYTKWSGANNLIILAGFIFALITNSYIYWIGLSILSFGIYVLKLPNLLPNFPFLIGYANWISLFRLVIILIAISFHDMIPDILLSIVFGAVILLDGLDGTVARRFNQTSKAGEYLDMEIDALFVFLISYLHYSEHKLPFWVIVPGSMRYLYGVLFHWMKEPVKIKPGKKIRSGVAAIFFVSLLFPFVIKKEISIPLVMLSSILIVISFGISALQRVIYLISFNRSSDLS